MEHMLNLLMDSGALLIEKCQTGEPSERDGFLQIIPIQVSFVARLQGVKKFLYACGHDKQYLTVDQLSLKSIREPTGETYFRLEAMLRTSWIK